MASIQKRPTGQWRARYRDNTGKEHSRHFDRKVDAQAFLDTVTVAVQTGTYVDPKLGIVTVGAWTATWLDGQVHLKPTTRERYEGIVREHILPKWATVRLTDVSHAQVQGWVARLGTQGSPATVHKVHRVLPLILALAVKDGRLARNPATGVNLPRVVAPEHRFLSHEQVRRLADECAVPPPTVSRHSPKAEHWNADYEMVVLFLAYTGVRFGEMAALRVGRVDFLRRRARIVESVTLVRGVQVWGTPKGHDKREVSIPRFLVELLAEHVAGKELGDLVFTGAKGGALRAQGFQRSVLTGAATRIGVPGLHPHELRHTAASLAIASGADVKVVQQMLGHKSATMTLDLYGHLFSDRLDEVADALDAAASAARTADSPADSLRTSRVVSYLPDRKEGAGGQ
jgi:integrase